MDPKQTNSLKLNEVGLLVMRLVALALISFILARPHLTGKMKETAIVYLIEKALISNEKVMALVDSVPAESLRLLSPDFPSLEEIDLLKEEPMVPNYWQLATQMDGLSADSIVVFTNGLQVGLKGMRPKAPSNVRWIVVDAQDSVEKFVEAIDTGQDLTSLKLRGDSRRTSFAKEKFSREDERIRLLDDSLEIASKQERNVVPFRKVNPIEVKILHDDSLIDQARYLESAYQAIGRYLRTALNVKLDNDTDARDSLNYDQLVWLSPKLSPENLGKTLSYRPDELSNKLIVPTGARNRFNITRALNPENVVKENLPEQLFQILDLRPNLKERIVAFDKRMADISELLPIKSKNPPRKDHLRLMDLSPWLWIPLILILVVERITAKYRKQ